MEQFRRGNLVFDVIDAGPADGPVVVLLQGFPQFATSWGPVIERLTAQGYRCLAPDQRGYSAGARPRGRRAYRVPELVEDIAALIDASGADKVHLVGHDWGAAAAWAFAAQYPDRLASLSALSVPHPAAFLRAMVTSRQGFASWYMYFFQLPGIPEWSLVGTKERRNWKRLARFLVDAKQSREAAERDARAMAESGAFHYALNWYRAIPLIDPRSTNTKISVPTLFGWSDGDTAVLRKAAETCHKWVTGPYRFEVLQGVSHWIPDEAPDGVAAMLLEQVTAYPT
jgi:pimeloyl-ACP methyl ester carboxylesterase